MNQVRQTMRDRESIGGTSGAAPEPRPGVSVPADIDCATAETAFRNSVEASGRVNAAEPHRVHGNDNLAPLVIDLDGALARTSIVFECILTFIRHQPLRIFQVLSWLMKGRSVLRQELALHVPLDAMAMPLDAAMAAYAAGEKAKGRKVYLAAAEDHSIARSIANRWGFDGVLVNAHDANSASQQSRDAGEEAFPSGFAYAGGSSADFSAWPRASQYVLVGGTHSAKRIASRLQKPTLILPVPSRLGALIECARPHQWAKNVLVFVPAILSGEISNQGSFMAVFLAFIALCVVASSTYVLNDIWDLADDRRHWSKCKRPIASGRLPLTTALAAVPIGLALGMSLAIAVSPAAGLVLSCYVALTLAYSFALKRVPVLDVTVLAGLFTLRLVLGIVSAGVFASPWLLVFSMFLFSSLCFAKRYVELERFAAQGQTFLANRGYQTADNPLLLGLGTGTGIASIIMLVLYIIFDAFRQTFYGNTVWLWAFPLILFLWFSRVWLVAARGALDDDPVAFAVKDTPSILLGGAMLVAFLLAWSGAFA